MAPGKCSRYLIQGFFTAICSEDTYPGDCDLHPELDVCSMKTRYLLNNSRQRLGVGIKGQT